MNELAVDARVVERTIERGKPPPARRLGHGHDERRGKEKRAEVVSNLCRKIEKQEHDHREWKKRDLGVRNERDGRKKEVPPLDIGLGG